MLRLLRWSGLGLVALLLVAGFSWLLSMPSSQERGIWRHEADGTLLSLGRIRADLYHASSAGCVPTMTFPAHMALVKAMEGAWVEASGDRLELHVDGALAPALFNRIEALPEECLSQGDATPAETFDAMWTVMNEHYAFFDLHGVDWDARRRMAPAPDASDEELFEAMKAALTGLDDGHVQLIAGPLGYFSPSLAPDWMPDPELERSDLNQIARDTIGVDLTAVDRTGLEYGLRDDGIGYVLIRGMSTDPAFGQLGSTLARKSFGDMVNALADAKAVIIDVRYNPGGDDATAFAYAGHLTPDPVLALTKRTRQGAGWTDPIEAVVQPLQPRLDQPVILLTGRLTGSGAEIFTMALREMPQVTVMGENTGGGLSDILGVTLPNGWLFGLSNQDYRTPDGSSYEGGGLPPDIAVPTDGGALVRGQDPVLEAAIAEALGLVQ